MRVTGIADGKVVALYNSSTCSSTEKISDDATMTNEKATLKTSYLRPTITYNLHLGIRDSADETTIDCQTPGKSYILYEPFAMGEQFTCYLFNHGKVVCWGDNEHGQLGQGNVHNIGNSTSTTNNSKPMSALRHNFIDLGTNKLAKAISAGRSHVCAILDDDSVKCWGQNNFGQLGQGNRRSIGDQANELGNNLSAVNLGTNRKAISITSGDGFNCAILDNKTAKCWGYQF